MKKLYYIVIALIFLLSFRCYSSMFYPILNSDNAVSILMIHYFKLPNDLYFWGQDRMGSLIPLLGQVFLKLFNFSALTSEAITHYLILLLGFLAFASFLKSHFYKIIFAIIWFFPPMRLIDVTQFSFGIHYSLIAIACYLFVNYQKEKIQKNNFFVHLNLVTIMILLIAAIWVSDMALISVFLLLAIQLLYFFKTHKFTFSLVKRPEFYYGLIGCIIGVLFIHYAKYISQNKQDYTTFADFNSMKETIAILWSSISDFFIFKANEPFTSVYSYFVLLIVGITMLLFKKNKFNNTSSKWILFFLLDAVLLFAIIIISKWTFINGVPRRYFTCTYISLSFVILLVLDNLITKTIYLKMIKTILFVTVFIGGIGTIYNILYIWPKTLTPKVEVVREFEKLGQIGIISEYWNSYITSCPNPEMIKATPNDQSWVRNQSIVEEVFQQPNIYIIKDIWLKTFPDSLNQFGRLLIKDGLEFRMGDCDVCKYKKISTN